MRPANVKPRIVSLVILGFVGLNVAAYRQARAFTHFAPPGHRTRPELLSFGGKVAVLLEGVDVPRPMNERTPKDAGLPYERHVFPGSRGIALEAWLIPRARARGTVVLFHGHAASKDSQIREARVFHNMGLSALLVDFYGSGGSAGSETSIGFYEAQDVSKAFAYARDLPEAGPVVLYGASMGAAAALKAVADDNLQPAALILECPFDSLAGTVRHRFTSRGLPSFPLADLLVFWGGVQEGFNAFQFRPVESAAQIQRPTLLMNGDSDPWVRPDEARALFEALRGPKTLKMFAGVGHDSYLRHRPDEWKASVNKFLDRVLGPPSQRDRSAGNLHRLSQGHPSPSVESPPKKRPAPLPPSLRCRVDAERRGPRKPLPFRPWRFMAPQKVWEAPLGLAPETSNDLAPLIFVLLDVPNRDVVHASRKVGLVTVLCFEPVAEHFVSCGLDRADLHVREHEEPFGKDSFGIPPELKENPEVGRGAVVRETLLGDARDEAGLLTRLDLDLERALLTVADGVDVDTLAGAAMEMVGHKTESIYRRYLITDEAMLKAASARLAALHEAERERTAIVQP